MAVREPTIADRDVVLRVFKLCLENQTRAEQPFGIELALLDETIRGLGNEAEHPESHEEEQVINRALDTALQYRASLQALNDLHASWMS